MPTRGHLETHPGEADTDQNETKDLHFISHYSQVIIQVHEREKINAYMWGAFLGLAINFTVHLLLLNIRINYHLPGTKPSTRTLR